MNKFGFTDVVLGAGVIFGSSINGVLSEKKIQSCNKLPRSYG